VLNVTVAALLVGAICRDIRSHHNSTVLSKHKNEGSNDTLRNEELTNLIHRSSITFHIHSDVKTGDPRGQPLPYSQLLHADGVGKIKHKSVASPWGSSNCCRNLQMPLLTNAAF
jgi:hypothetical protein